MGDYCKPLDRSFTCRTNTIIQRYSGEFDATLLLNCLLGMLVVPFEKNNHKFKVQELTGEITTMFTRLKEANCYDSFGNNYNDYDIIRYLRNTIAHFNVEFYSDEGKIKEFEFISHSIDLYCKLKKGNCSHKSVITGNPVFRVKMSLKDIKELAKIIKNNILTIQNSEDCKECIYRSY